jgi:hypothetical protein
LGWEKGRAGKNRWTEGGDEEQKVKGQEGIWGDKGRGRKEN